VKNGFTAAVGFADRVRRRRLRSAISCSIHPAREDWRRMEWGLGRSGGRGERGTV